MLEIASYDGYCLPSKYVCTNNGLDFTVLRTNYVYCEDYPSLLRKIYGRMQVALTEQQKTSFIPRAHLTVNF